MLSLGTTACGVLGDGGTYDPAGNEGVYAGVYTQGIEDSWFEPCYLKDEVWKIVVIEDTTFFSRLSEVGENPVYVELRGTPGEAGEYSGFFATYDRKFVSQKIEKAGSLKKNRCLKLPF
jgi:hypothetical protein